MERAHKPITSERLVSFSCGVQLVILFCCSAPVRAD